MIPSKTCIDLLKAWEGIEDGDPSTVRLDPYLDPVGIWTIGYGRALRGRDGQFLRGRAGQAAAKALYPKGISLQEAEALLTEDASKTARALVAANVAGSQKQFDAFVSLAFNIGVGDPRAPRSGGFIRSSLLRMHRDGRPTPWEPWTNTSIRNLADASKLKATPQTIAEGFTAYSWAGGRWMLGLFRRRIAEFLIYRGETLETALKYARGFSG